MRAKESAAYPNPDTVRGRAMLLAILGMVVLTIAVPKLAWRWRTAACDQGATVLLRDPLHTQMPVFHIGVVLQFARRAFPDVYALHEDMAAIR